jgi:hypothetical protein
VVERGKDALVEDVTGGGVERDGAAKAEVGAAAKSKCEQGCFAGAPVEQDGGGDVLTSLGVGEVGLAEGAWPVVGHARGEVFGGVPQHRYSSNTSEPRCRANTSLNARSYRGRRDTPAIFDSAAL